MGLKSGKILIFKGSNFAGGPTDSETLNTSIYLVIKPYSLVNVSPVSPVAVGLSIVIRIPSLTAPS